MMKSINLSVKCPFCKASGLVNRCVVEEKDFLFVTDAYPVSFGHTLLVPKYHYLSFAYLPVELLRKAENLIKKFCHILIKTSPVVIVFEHGNKNQNVSGRISIDHAHFHLIPVQESLIGQLPHPERKAIFQDLPSYVCENSYYFYLEFPADSAVWGEDSEIGSQFIRRLVCGTRDNNSRSWDWKQQQKLNNKTIKHHTQCVRDLFRKAGYAL